MAKKIQLRKLKETSWLAQIIADKMETEFNKNGASARYNCLAVLKIVINEADDSNNETIYYDNENGKRTVTICDIPSMTIKYGYDFDKEGMQNKLRGLAERYKDFDGNYLVSVLTTNDLNSCIINDLSELLFEMNV